MTVDVLVNDILPTQRSPAKQKHDLYASIENCVKEKMKDRLPNKAGQNWKKNFKSYDGNHFETFKEGVKAVTGLECAYEKISEIAIIDESTKEAVYDIARLFEEGKYEEAKKLAGDLYTSLRNTLPTQFPYDVFLRNACAAPALKEVYEATKPKPSRTSCR